MTSQTTEKMDEKMNLNNTICYTNVDTQVENFKVYFKYLFYSIYIAHKDC